MIVPQVIPESPDSVLFVRIKYEKNIVWKSLLALLTILQVYFPSGNYVEPTNFIPGMDTDRAPELEYYYDERWFYTVVMIGNCTLINNNALHVCSTYINNMFILYYIFALCTQRGQFHNRVHIVFAVEPLQTPICRLLDIAWDGNGSIGWLEILKARITQRERRS